MRRSSTLKAVRLSALFVALAGTNGLAQGPAQQAEQAPKPITNIFVDTEVRQALGDMAVQAGVIISPDETVSGTVSAGFKDTPFEQALTIILSPGNFSWKKMAGFYLVGRADPASPNYFRFATTQTYKPNYLSAERLATLMPTPLATYIKSSPGELALTITAAPQMMDTILETMKMVDQPPQRLVIEALVTEVSSETLNQYSFSWLWRQFGLSTDTDGSEFKYTKATQSDVVTLKGLIGDGKAEVRANPRIMAIEGKEALVEVAQENYFQVITGPANFPYASLQNIKTGISLKVTPIVSENGEVTLALSPEVSDAVGSGPGGLPINTVRRATTTVRVKDGETVVIGGMSYLSSRNRQNKVPILGDIPILGQLFRSKSQESRKTEVIIMVTPHIMKEAAPTEQPQTLEEFVLRHRLLKQGQSLALAPDVETLTVPQTKTLVKPEVEVVRSWIQPTTRKPTNPIPRPVKPGR